MGDNVLNDEEIEWVKAHADTINQFAAKEFAGHVPMDDRVMFERLSWKVNGRSFPIKWTCSPCIEQIGRLLKTKL